jgi:hypothetical protein
VVLVQNKDLASCADGFAISTPIYDMHQDIYNLKNKKILAIYRAERSPMRKYKKISQLREDINTVTDHFFGPLCLLGSCILTR